jgi:hypothetical protein
LLDLTRLSGEAMIEERRPVGQSAEAATPSPSPSQRSRGASRHRRSRS